MTKDKNLIAMHDTKVDRNTNGEGLVKDKKLDAGSWFSQGHRGEKVPELAEILEKYYNKTNFYIETKKPDTYPGMDKQLVEELNKKVLLSKSKLKKGKVIVQSFSEESLINIHKLNKYIPLIKLITDNDVDKLSNNELQLLSKYA